MIAKKLINKFKTFFVENFNISHINLKYKIECNTENRNKKMNKQDLINFICNNNNKENQNLWIMGNNKNNQI